MKFKVTPEMIKELRKRHHITQQKLAASLFHINRERITDWESGRRNCPPIIWWAIKITWDKIDIWGKDERNKT